MTRVRATMYNAKRVFYEDLEALEHILTGVKDEITSIKTFPEQDRDEYKCAIIYTKKRV